MKATARSQAALQDDDHGIPDNEHPGVDFRRKMEHLFRQQNPALIGMLYVRLGDRESAREVAQEAYERVFARERNATLTILRAATSSHLRNYIFRTALNIAANRRRDSKVRNGHLEKLYSENEYPSAEKVCIQHQEWSRLQRALNELPHKCGIAFTLVEIQCISPSEVAVRLGVKRNTVYQLVRRAYAHLMTVMSDT